MGKKANIFIIHPSAIVRSGLAGILRNYFNCIIKESANLNLFKNHVDNLPANSLLFTSIEISRTIDLVRLLSESDNVTTICIIENSEVNIISNYHCISLNDSPEEITNKLKNILWKYQTIINEDENELTAREIDVLKLVSLGYSNKEIADKLFISTHTVISHRKNITEKLGIKSASGLTVYAIINNYVDTTCLNINDLI